uniref:Uncharacterized protein n=1 Tax=Timema cristinae TaxID=61476 RepID=A0A7R9CMR2_TIMCR|nr:unnamed protein product [Timema cristinae]
MHAIVDVTCDEAGCFVFQSFTYVSTAYSNYPRKEVHEKVYSPPMDPHKIQREVAAMSKEELARKEKSGASKAEMVWATNEDEKERMPKKMGKITHVGKRPQGRPRKRWEEQITESVSVRFVPFLVGISPSGQRTCSELNTAAALDHTNDRNNHESHQ